MAIEKCERCNCFTYWGSDRKQYNGCHKSFQKRWITLKMCGYQRLKEAWSAVTMILLLKTCQKWFLICNYLACSLKIFINVFAFVYEKANSKEICEEISFPSFFRKMLLSAILLRIKANYLKNVWLPEFFFVDSNNPCKDLFCLLGPNLVQRPSYLRLVFTSDGVRVWVVVRVVRDLMT